MRPTSAVWLLALALGAALLFVLTLASGRSTDRREIRTTLSLADALGAGDTTGYARAFEPRPFVFPADHGEHPDFATEWWYFTGNLETSDGRRFGYQLTFFRRALAPGTEIRASAWATRQAWMAHFAVTNVSASRFLAFERFSRGALQLAGATVSPFRVWLEDWSLEGDSARAFPVRIRAAEENTAIDLVIEPGKPIVPQGNRGLSRKGPEAGNASYYYSMTRMPTTGSITFEGERHVVNGSSWLDREWSTSALRSGLAGWDWFALQFDDNTELMLYRLRRDDGVTDPFSGGTFIGADGSTTAFNAGDITIEETRYWSSSLDGTRYPSEWTLRIAPLALTIDIEPLVSDQELNLAVRYWEGAVTGRATRGAETRTAIGYVELTGYAGPPSSRAFPDGRSN